MNNLKECQMFSVKIFGKLIGLIGSDTVDMGYVADTDNLQQQLIERFPALAQEHFLIAINREIIHAKTLLEPEVEVALLPPFSGG